MREAHFAKSEDLPRKLLRRTDRRIFAKSLIYENILNFRRNKMNRIFKKYSILSLVLALVLIAAMVLTFVSCDKKTSDEAVTSDASVDSEVALTAVGEGEKSFEFFVKFADGTIQRYTVNTDADTVGEALVDAGLITGSEGPYGLMVEAVCGVKLDYNTDKMYWSFNINGKYAMTGVDGTEINEDSTYSFEATEA